jgi:hypothetical protein
VDSATKTAIIAAVLAVAALIIFPLVAIPALVLAWLLIG